MNILFCAAAAIAIVSSIAAVSRNHAIHAILFLVVSFVSVSLVFYTLGAPFIAALEVITYAGAIMVLFMFAIMLLNLGAHAVHRERQWQPRIVWIGSGLLSLVLLAELAWTFSRNGAQTGNLPVPPAQVGLTLFGTYLLGVELASMLLLAGLVGAYYLGKRSGASVNTKGASDDDGPA
jgi:NADH-quinone oxidoreductase subunit J